MPTPKNGIKNKTDTLSKQFNLVDEMYIMQLYTLWTFTACLLTHLWQNKTIHSDIEFSSSVKL